MRAIFEDHLTEQLHRGTKGGGLPQDSLDRPVLVASMARGHVVGDGGVLAVAGAAHVDGDAVTFEENFNGP